MHYILYLIANVVCSNGVQEVQAFWFLIVLVFLRSMANIVQKWSMVGAIKGLLSILVLVSTLLLQPWNVILIPYLVFSSVTIQSNFKQVIDCSLSHVWLGAVVYFYQASECFSCCFFLSLVLPFKIIQVG